MFFNFSVTPTEWAAEEGHIKVIEIIVKHGSFIISEDRKLIFPPYCPMNCIMLLEGVK